MLKKTNWLNNLNIGTIMLTEPINLSKFNQYKDVYLQMNQQNISLKLIYISICLFSISTELRLSESYI